MKVLFYNIRESTKDPIGSVFIAPDGHLDSDGADFLASLIKQPAGKIWNRVFPTTSDPEKYLQALVEQYDGTALVAVMDKNA